MDTPKRTPEEQRQREAESDAMHREGFEKITDDGIAPQV